ncbi:unnamed protein product [Ixodes persulcatus]
MCNWHPFTNGTTVASADDRIGARKLDVKIVFALGHSLSIHGTCSKSEGMFQTPSQFANVSRLCRIVLKNPILSSENRYRKVEVIKGRHLERRSFKYICTVWKRETVHRKEYISLSSRRKTAPL